MTTTRLGGPHHIKDVLEHALKEGVTEYRDIDGTPLTKEQFEALVEARKPRSYCGRALVQELVRHPLPRFEGILGVAPTSLPGEVFAERNEPKNLLGWVLGGLVVAGVVAVAGKIAYDNMQLDSELSTLPSVPREQGGPARMLVNRNKGESWGAYTYRARKMHLLDWELEKRASGTWLSREDYLKKKG
jgi:hypothetical protein